MSLLAVAFSIGAAGKWFDLMDRTKEKLLRGQLKEEGAELLQQGAVSGNISIPVPRVPHRTWRVGYGSRKVTTLPAEAAPLIRRNFLQGTSLQINTGHVGMIEISVDIPPDLQKHSAQ
jgi:hypothetical protein